MMMRRLLFAGCLSTLHTLVWGQLSVQGTVRDAGSNEPVSGVHIIGFGRNSRQGTSTNGEGQFTLHVPSEPDSIRITCIGYQSQTLRKKNFASNSLDVRLEAAVTALEALTVKPASPQQLIREAVRAMPTNYTSPPFQTRGFYREVIRRDTVYYSVAEAVFETQLLKPGEEGLLKLVQGRRSETVKSTRIFEDYHPGGGPNFLINHMLEAQLPEFLEEKNFKEYDFSIDSITSYDGKDVYKITFDQRDGLKKNLWAGAVYIDAESSALVELHYALSDKGIEYRKHLSGADKVMADLLGIDFIVNRKYIHYSYHKEGSRWSLHDAGLTMDIHFTEPRKSIDEHFTFNGELLSIRQATHSIKPFAKSEVWQKNRLVKNLPGEFDEGFWGDDNYIKAEKSLTAAVAAMDVLRAEKLPADAPEGWSMLHGEEAKAYRRDSTFILKPYVESRWKDAGQGPLLWKTMTGDFELYARVSVTKTLDTAAAPNTGFQVGGLMLRNGGEGPENHVFVALGCLGNPQLKIIGQNTINGRSAMYVSKIDGHELHLLLRRSGERVELHYLSPETRQWVRWKEIQRKDLPADLQVGVAGYSWLPGDAPNRHPDLLIHAKGLRALPIHP